MWHIYSEIIQEEDTLVLYILEEHEKGEEIKDRIPFTKDELIDAFEQYGWSFVQALWKCLQCADPINTWKIFDTWKNYVEQYVISYLKK